MTMIKKLELDSLRSQLENIERLESRAREVGDPVGTIQFRMQRERINQQIVALGNSLRPLRLSQFISVERRYLVLAELRQNLPGRR